MSQVEVSYDEIVNKKRYSILERAVKLLLKSTGDADYKRIVLTLEK